MIEISIYLWAGTVLMGIVAGYVLARWHTDG